MKRKGRNAAVSLQNKAMVKAPQCKSKYLTFFFWRYSINSKNDNKEKNASSKSPLAGIQATEETKRGCTQKTNVLNNANFDGIKSCLSKR